MRVVVFFLCLVLSSCSKQPSKQPRTPTSKPTIIVSVPVYRYFVERIAGDTVSVHSLVPAGANPHVYEPTPKEMHKFQNSALFIRLGDPSEKKVFATLQERNPHMHTLNVTEGIELLPSSPHCCAHDREAQDLHVWLSPQLAKVQATQIAFSLIDLQPQYTEQYAQGLALFLNELNEIDLEIRSLLEPKRGSAIVVSHPAFGYFCRDYGLLQLSIEIEGKDPLPQDVCHLLDMAQKHHAMHVVIEPQYSSRGAEAIAASLKVPTSLIDPYSENYLDNLKHIAQIFAQ